MMSGTSGGGGGNSLQMVEAKLPAGFRFHPKDDELICDYLMMKVARSELPPFLMEVDLNHSEPWDIPESACVGGKEWYFYSQRDRKYATGLRTNRATAAGYWKATGKDRAVSRKGRLVGMRKTLVFYEGRAPKGKKTEWVMHEFRLEGPLCPPKFSLSKEDWVLCRVFYKNKEVLIPAAKQDKRGGSNCSDETNSSTYHHQLPPLMDDPPPPPSYDVINFEDYEQVPCFSIFNPSDQQTTNFSPFMNINTTTTLPAFRHFPVAPPPPQLMGCSSEDKLVIDAVLSHLTKMDNNFVDHVNPPDSTTTTTHDDYGMMMMIKDSPCSFEEGRSEQSFLSDVWNN